MRQVEPGKMARMRFARHGLRAYYALEPGGHAALTGKPEHCIALHLPVGHDRWHEMSRKEARSLAEALTTLAAHDLE